MPEGRDSFSFDKGLNTRKNSYLMAEGELQACSGLSFENDGYISPLKPRVAKTHDTYGTIHNIHKYMNKIIMNEGSSVRYKWDLRDYCALYTEPDGNYTACTGAGHNGRSRLVDYNGWTFMANGFKNLAFLNGHLYTWNLPAPTVTPIGTAGTAGNPNGTYYLYYTFVYYFPNGDVYESGPSGYGTVSVSSQAIEWSNIQTSPYSGEGVIVKRALYRYSTSLADIYYIATIGDNTTTTYSDDVADGTAQLNAIMTCDDYSTPPDDIVDLELYLYRIFAVKGTYLYWSEPYLPFTFKKTSAINFSDNGKDLMGIVYWGDQLYIPTKHRWYRLYGTDPDTWAKKETYADMGVNNTHTIAKTKYGILASNYDGLYLFDGTTSRNITLRKLGRALFESVYDHESTWATYDGLRYYYYYSTTSSTPDTCLIADFTFYPEIRFFNDPFIPTAYEFDQIGKRKIYAYGGITYEEGTSGGSAINLSLLTGDKSGGDVLQRKNVKYLYYDINTHGKDVTVTMYVDGTADATTITLNESARKRGRIEDCPSTWSGYRFAIALSCSSVTDDDLEIYAPFAIGWTTAGS